jgi:cadmium resistance protein CadD (predicted permease)
MIISVKRNRLRTAIATLGVAALLAVLGFFLPNLKLRTAAWGAVAGLLLPLVFIAPVWLTRARASRPEDVRNRIQAREKKINVVHSAAAVFGGCLGIFLQYFLSANAHAALIGIAFGMIIFMILLTGPEYWMRKRPERPKRTIPLEPMENSNRIHIVHPPPRAP